MNRNVKNLQLYEFNPRKISKEEFKKLTDSLEELGDLSGIILNLESKQIIGGNQRVKWFKLLDPKKCSIEITEEFKKPDKQGTVAFGFIVADGYRYSYREVKWDEETEKKANLRANKLGGEDDNELLAKYFSDVELEMGGYTESDITSLMQEVNIEDPETNGDDDSQERDKEVVTTVPGDLYELGGHRLLCGDSTNADDVEKLTGDNNPIAMITDPPYGVEYDPSWRECIDSGGSKLLTGKVKNDDISDWTEAYSLFGGDVAYVWHAGKYAHKVGQNIQDSGFSIVSQIIWAKQHFALSRGDYHWQHEPLWYAVRNGSKHNWQGKRDQSTLWEIKNNNPFGNSDKEETWGHSTQKPVECMLRPILNNTKKGDCVYDPFGGSGTTLIASEKSKRKCLMMEIEPSYCDLIVRRYVAFCKENNLDCSVIRNGSKTEDFNSKGS